MKIPQSEITTGHVRVAAYDPLTEAHGPGKRFALWLQGCPILCPGCTNPEMLSEEGGSTMRVSQIVSLIHRQVLGGFPIDGITFMGGEPMTQAVAVADILQWCKENTGLNTILFSGYTLESLRKSDDANVQRVLKLLDVLIDGPYVEDKRAMGDIRGSSNQKIHHLNDKRLEGVAFTRKTAEFLIDGGDAEGMKVIQTGFRPDQIKI